MDSIRFIFFLYWDLELGLKIIDPSWAWAVVGRPTSSQIQLKNNIGKYCAADYALYDSVKTYMYTRPHFNLEKTNDSNIHTDHFSTHARASDTIARYYLKYKTWLSSVRGEH